MDFLDPISFLKGTFHNDTRLTYAIDGLVTSHHFEGQHDNYFKLALENSRGQCDHPLYHEWRLCLSIQVQLQVIASCIKNNEDYIYIECGVGEGHTILMTQNYLKELGGEYFHKWDVAPKLLFDTYEGVDKNLLDIEDEEKHQLSAYHGSSIEITKARLKDINQKIFIEGSIPSTLQKIPLSFHSPKFLHIDLNNYAPEVAALDFFYPRMKQGSIILFDDYSFQSAHKQRIHINKWCEKYSAPKPLNLPTGQGLIIL